MTAYPRGVARTEGEKKPISPVASTVMAVLLTGGLAYLGATLLSFGGYALGEGETFIGLIAVVLGGVLLAGVLAIVVSQARAWLRGRR